MTKTLCCIKDCENPITSVGFCKLHYNRFNLYGHPLAGELHDYQKPRLPYKKEKQARNAMIKRCYDSTKRNYSYYGGRGIRVCDRWLLSFENFYDDLGEAPDGSSLERINVNGNYEPANCKWANVFEQNRNQRSTRLNKEMVTEAHLRLAKGEKLADIARSLGVKYHTLYSATSGLSWMDMRPEGNG